jgi:hypothetical protein
MTGLEWAQVWATPVCWRYFPEIVENKFTFRNSLDCVLFVSFSVFYSSTKTYVTYPSFRRNSTQKEARTFEVLSKPTLFRDVPCSAALQNGKKKGELHPCTGTEALYRSYGP